ncbi:hypothetical protein BDW62DRAFT_215957 [Aspergillus aurantiobrunneus]
MANAKVIDRCPALKTELLPLRGCRCLPSDHCWPSTHEWDTFNRTVNGHLLQVKPVGSVCHGKEFDQVGCDDVKANTHDSVWRISEPGALQWTNWEGDDRWGTCTINGAKKALCKQGRLPLYKVMAQLAQEVQAAVQFAKRRNLHVAIRNTGHDGIGRSSGPGSVQINVSKLKQMRFMDEFTPQGGNESQGQAVTVGAGVLGMEVLEAGRRRGLNVITGTPSSLAATGGFLQGGGIGILSPAYGLAADNALEFTLVTAEGNVVVANDFQNEDLFWALRGGGGGTFGVVLDTTIRTFPDVPAVYFWMTMTIPKRKRASLTAEQALWNITTELTNLVPALKRFNDTASAIIFTRLLEVLDGRTLPYESNVTVYPRLSTYLSRPKTMDRAGYGLVESSVLVSEELFYQPNGTSTIMDVLSGLKFEVGDSVEILMTGGGQVKANKGIINTESMVKRMRNSQLPALRSLESRYMGSYPNVADPDEPNYQRAFWGDNYPGLSQVKRYWDRDGLFTVRMGVNNEIWDSEGICRVKHP